MMLMLVVGEVVGVVMAGWRLLLLLLVRVLRLCMVHLGRLRLLAMNMHVRVRLLWGL